jgi:Rrf2 family nitric oxide-sensitive transcriptional repressor
VHCGNCIIAPACGLTGALHQALAAFLTVLDGYTLESLLAQRLDITGLFERAGPVELSAENR